MPLRRRAMSAWPPRPPTFLTPLIFLLAGGCSGEGAPSLTLFGAFFPAWMLCAVLGIAVAIAARICFIVWGLSRVLPFQLFVCASIGLVFALPVWLLLFGR